MTKLFGVNYETCSSTAMTPTAGPPLPPQPQPPRSSTLLGLARSRSHGASTVDSGELEWCIRENTALVPSYSEALLLDQSQLPATTSSYSIRATNNNNITSDQRRGSNSNRRSWGSIILNFNRTTSQDNVSQSSAQRVLYYSSPLAEGCPSDPFRGREATTPTEEPPPSYEEALRFPVLTRLRRSLTDRGEICRRSLFSQRRSCYGEPSPVSVHNEIRVAPRGRTLITMETSL